MFAVTGLVAFYERLKESEKKGSRFIFVFILFMFLWGYNIIAWYRARCALLGLVVFALLMLVPMKVWANRVFYALVTFAMTAGAILISLVYVWLGRTGTFDIRIFYKDIISGRDAIWADLWSAFIKMPLTGIGSSYKINVDWMGGMFEVHNGLLDILIVHGAVVFAVTVFMLIKRLFNPVINKGIIYCAVVFSRKRQVHQHTHKTAYAGSCKGRSSKGKDCKILKKGQPEA